jgi:hypothetical protein
MAEKFLPEGAGHCFRGNVIFIIYVINKTFITNYSINLLKYVNYRKAKFIAVKTGLMIWNQRDG